MLHTEGPWKAELGQREPLDDIQITADDGHVSIASVVCFWPCGDERPGKEHEREGRANARLIAAAPDLLAALKALLANVEDTDMGLLDRQGEFMTAARAAIAKAEGQRP